MYFVLNARRGPEARSDRTREAVFHAESLDRRSVARINVRISSITRVIIVIHSVVVVVHGYSSYPARDVVLV